MLVYRSAHIPEERVLFFKRATAYLLSLLAAAALLCAPAGASAAGNEKRFVAIVYDDSSSMRSGDASDGYIYANYALQNIVAFMREGDTAKLFLFSRKGAKPAAVKRQRDLYGLYHTVGTSKSSLATYAVTVNAAFKAGAAFLKSNPEGRFLFVLVTDGGKMFDDRAKEIKGSLKTVFSGYLEGSGLGGLGSRAEALLLSVGSGEPLAPVADLRAALGDCGIETGAYAANVSDKAAAGESMMAAAAGLAGSMAGNIGMEIDPGKPFAIRYPLKSLTLVAQFPEGGAAAVKSIRDAGGNELALSTLYTAKAVGGQKLASAVLSAVPPAGCLTPGTYTLEASGKARIFAIPEPDFAVNVRLSDGAGKAVAEYAGGRWSVSGIDISVGGKLTAKVGFTAPGGAYSDAGPGMAFRFGDAAGFSCAASGSGAFTLEGVKAGQDSLALGLSDPEYFQIPLPPLGIRVREMPAASSGPTPRPSAAPSAQGLPSSAPPGASASFGPSSAVIPAQTALPVLPSGRSRWPLIAAAAAVALLAAAYALFLALKRRIPMDIRVSVSPNSDMAFSTGARLGRNMAKRSCWPFGGETCALGLMELRAHPKSRSHVLLCGDCVQYGLRINGRTPQYFMARDRAGNFVIGENDIFGIREDGRYLYYRITFPGRKRVSRRASTQLGQRWQ